MRRREEVSVLAVRWTLMASVLVGLLFPGLAAATVSVTPSPSYTGNYTVSWTDGSGDDYIVYLAQSLNGGAWTRVAVTGTYSKAFTAMAVGDYAYKIQVYFYDPELRREFHQHDTAAVTVSVWKSVPAMPGATTGPVSDDDGTYTLNWTQPPGIVTKYEVLENSVKISPDPTSISVTLTGRAAGNWTYQVRACNDLGCGPYNSSFTVLVVANLGTGVPNAAVGATEQSLAAPMAQGWAGRLHGRATVDGGAAGYQIDIELPPGRGGLQPAVGLSYSSRDGNGVAGVGWSLSGGGSIYRCPKTFGLDGANAPVRLDGEDRLCLDGQRLVRVAGSPYGVLGSEYRTEMESFARVTLLGGNMGSTDSYFKVERKSGITAIYRARSPEPGAVQAPSTWPLSSENDPRGNCMSYTNSRIASRGLAAQWGLTGISYGGRWLASYESCYFDGTARSIAFLYEERPDRRVTYQAGAGSLLSMRLSAITTAVGGTLARRYQFEYTPSGATTRSLLRSVRVCSTSPCRTDGTFQVPATTFTYEEGGPSFSPRERFAEPVPNPSWPDWRVNLATDNDGDGAADLSYHLTTGTASQFWWLRMTSTGAFVELDPETFTAAEFPANGGGGSVDMDNDGRADVLGIAGKVSYLSYKSGAWQRYDTALPWSGPLVAMDYNGDGLLDLSDYTSVWLQQVPWNPGAGRSWPWSPPVFEANPSVTLPPQALPSVRRSFQDVNGDDYPDAVYDGQELDGRDRDVRIVFNRGLAASSLEMTLPQLGGPSGSFKLRPERRWVDVNGDGLDDIYYPGGNIGDWGQAPGLGTIWINRGGAPGSGMFYAVPVSVDAVIPFSRWNPSFTTDIDADGKSELLVPSVRTEDYCGANLNGPEPEAWCGARFDEPTADASRDQSIFSWRYYRFVEQADGSYRLVPTESNLEAPINTGLGIQSGDFPAHFTASRTRVGADGMTDFAFLLTKGVITGAQQLYGFYPRLADADMGPYVTLNTARAPDLMLSATDGLGAVSRWGFQPISEPTLTAECDQGTGRPFYQARLSQQERDVGDVFFASSMWAAAWMEESNGVGTGTNRTCYRYEDGMLNTLGRGFLGFRVIVAEEALPPADGEDSAGLFSANNLRTSTEFLQQYPFTNRRSKVTVERVRDQAKLSEVTTHWHAEPSNGNSLWVVYANASREEKFDPGTGSLGWKSSVTQIDLESGDTQRSCVLSFDPTVQNMIGLPPGVVANPRAYHDEFKTIVNDPTAWWLGKVASSTSISDKPVGSVAPLENPTLASGLPTRGGGASASPLGSVNQSPIACPSYTATSAARSTFSEFNWVGAGVNGYRLPLRKTTRPLGAAETEQETGSMTYDQYGNLTSQTVTARNVVDGSNNRIQHITTATPSADGYFIEKVTNPEGHEERKQFDPATGLVKYQQQIQGGPVTTYEYDTLGRPLSALTAGAQQVNYRVDGCLPYGSLPCEPDEVLVRQTTQAGSPTRTEYLDRLERVVRATSPSMNGWLVVTEVQYNQRGLKVAELEPRFDGSAPYGKSYTGFDYRGRPARRTVTRNPSLYSAGSNSSPLVTYYQYVGGTTFILADEGGPAPLSMSRTYDMEGRLLETMQHLATPAPSDIRARYVYGVGGLLTHVIDPGNNDLAAEYDNLGRKTKVIDPDRGTWLYTWDGLGRLQYQTDARATVTTMGYDKIGRPTSRTVVVGPAVASSAYWTYDLPGGLGRLGREEDSYGYHRDFTYDLLLRPSRVQTTIPSLDTKQPSGNRVFTVEYGYDANYGRLKAVRYPSNVNLVGETVALKYDARGYLTGEVGLNLDLTEAKRYRQVTGLTERGQIADQWLGNCVREAGEYDPSTGLALTLSATAQARTTLPTTDLSVCGLPAGIVKQSKYKYDRFLNLTSQSKNVSGLQADERFSYDELQRLLSSGRCWGAGCTPTADNTDTYKYDDLGNITSKSDFGTGYLYGSGSRSIDLAGPHAVRQVTKVGGAVVNYRYDQNGNLQSGDGRTIDFDELDRPSRVVSGGITSEFMYGPGGGRYGQKVTGTGQPNFAPKTVYYLDKDYELTVWDTGATTAGTVEERTFIGGSVVTLTTVSTASVKERKVRYVHTDRLGSVEETTEEVPNPVPLSFGSHGFDPWGKPRSGTWTASGERLHLEGEALAESSRGFTGHEQLDAHYLTHMNGRVYDYRLGRFLSVDPIISNPASTQSINPYSYIGNNPLSGVDPTGYAPGEITTDGKRGLCGGTDGAGNCTTGSSAQAEVDSKFGGVWAKIKSWFSGAETPTGNVATSSPSDAGSVSEVARKQGGHSAEEVDNQQLLKDRNYLANGVGETLKIVKPYAEGVATLNPIVAAQVAVTGEQATGGEATTGERVLAGAVAAGPLLKALGWLKRLVGFGEAEATTIRTTQHGAERLAGTAATRGGVLTAEQVSTVRAMGQTLRQADGATVKVIQLASGRFNVVVEGERGIITTFQNISQKSFDRLANNYGWTAP